MSGDIDAARFWSMVRQCGVCMLASVDESVEAGVIRARPMAPIAEPDAPAIFFFTDRRSHKRDELQSETRVCLTFQVPEEGIFVSVSGRAALLADAAMIREKWDEEADTWFPDGPGDPNARLLRVRPEAAEYWYRPYDLETVKQRLRDARARGEEPDLGAHGRLSF